MNKPQQIFEATLVVIGMIGIVLWLWVMFSISGAPTTGDRSPVDCFTAAGDAC